MSEHPESIDVTEKQEDLLVDLGSGLLVSLAPVIISSDPNTGSFIQNELSEHLAIFSGLFDIDPQPIMEKADEKADNNIEGIHQKALELSGSPEDLLSNAISALDSMSDIDAEVIEAEDEEDALRQIQSILQEKSDSGEHNLDFGNFKYAIVDEDNNVIDDKVYDEYENAEGELGDKDSEDLRITEVMI